MMKSTFTATFTSTKAALVCGIAAFALPASVSAQEQWSQPTEEEATLTVTGNLPADISGLPEGPEIDGFISARSDNRIQVTAEDGSRTVLFVADDTEIKVWDSSGHSRWFVIPERPSGTDDFTDEQLMDLVTTESMMGVALAGQA